MSYQLEHHVWCNNYNANRKGCLECDRMFKKYPDVSWHNLHERTEHYFGGKDGRDSVETSRKPVR